MSELQELFNDELADLYSAEQQLVKALPRLAKAAQSEALREALTMHLEQTKNQVQRLEQVFKLLGKPAKAKRCAAMAGLVEEGSDVISDYKGSPALDAALICAAQKVEHYEIASYGTLCTWAKQLGNQGVLRLLKETMKEEESADKKLTVLAETKINLAADQEKAPKGGRGQKRGAGAAASATATAGAKSGQKRSTTLKVATKRFG